MYTEGDTLIARKHVGSGGRGRRKSRRVKKRVNSSGWRDDFLSGFLMIFHCYHRTRIVQISFKGD